MPLTSLLGSTRDLKILLISLGSTSPLSKCLIGDEGYYRQRGGEDLKEELKLPKEQIVPIAATLAAGLLASRKQTVTPGSQDAAETFDSVFKVLSEKYQK